jgi:hypothetical protein
MSGSSQAGSKVTPGVEQILVDRVAVAAEPDRDDIDGHLVERDRDEHFALALGELADRGRQGLELLSPLEPVTGAERKHVRHPLEHGFLTARGLSTPGVARHLAGDLEHHELVSPGSEPAEPAELVELRQDVHERVVRSLVGEIVELGPADRSQLTAPP